MRGGCFFEEKAIVAARNDAIGLIVVDHESSREQLITMTGMSDSQR
jgi:hypothetical protein